MNRKKVIIGIILLLIVVVLLFIIFKLTYIETEGDYTGYQLILTAKYGGSGIAGQDLGSGTKKKIYNISQNDILYEPFSGGLWLLNVDIEEDNDEKLVLKKYISILEIVKLEEDTVTIKNEDNTYNIEYNQEFNISSSLSVSDGINYSYVIEITKEE